MRADFNILRWMSAAFALSLVVRLVYLAAFQDSLFARYLLVDAAWHDRWAWEWAQGEWVQREAFYRAPLYPYFLSWVYGVFGHSLLAVRLCQALLSASAAAALTGAAGTLAGRGAAAAAMGLAALYGPWLFFDGELLIPALLLTLLSWALLVLVRARSPRALAAAGVLLGLAVVARPNALVLLIPATAWVWSLVRSRALTVSLYRAAMPLLVAALVPALYVTFLNYRAEQCLVPVSSQGGFNLYAGNHVGATGRSPAIPQLRRTTSWEEFLEESREIAQRDAGRPLNSAERSAYWVGRAWDYARAHPGPWAALTAKKLYYLVNAYEIPNNRDPYLNQPWPLRPLLWTTPWFSFPWGLVFPLAVVGLISLGVRYRPAAALLGGWILVYGLSVAAFFVCARFRLGLLPPVLLAAALPFGWGLRAVPRTAWIAGAAALLLVNTSWWNVQERNLSQELTKLGALQLESGRWEEGLATLEASHRQAPKDVTTMYLLADTYYELGRYQEAIPLFERVVDRRPTDHRALFALGTSYLAADRLAQAQEVLERASRRKGKDAGTWTNLGVVYAARDLPEKAEAAFRRAVELAPKADKAYLGLADLRLARGAVREAGAVLAGAVQEGAGSRDVWLGLARCHLALGEGMQAEAALRELLQRHPEDAEARALLSALRDEPRTSPDSTGSGAGGS